MTTDSTVSAFRHPDTIDDPLTTVLRDDARRLLAEAIEAEASAFLAAMKDERLTDGRARFVRHGHGPERTIQTGIGPVPVKRAKVRDRGTDNGGERVPFTSAILPKWARRTTSLDALLPVLHLRGLSTGDFQEALSALLGKDAPNLSPSLIARLKDDWQADYDRWQHRDLSARHYVYVWADGVYLQARMEDAAACMLVIIGATPEGKKELVGFQVGVRESAQSWRELLVDLKARGLSMAIAVGDGAMGFWKALDEIFPGTKHQRCWGLLTRLARLLDVSQDSNDSPAPPARRMLLDRQAALIDALIEDHSASQDLAQLAHSLLADPGGGGSGGKDKAKPKKQRPSRPGVSRRLRDEAAPTASAREQTQTAL